jgi:hypothetical protein
LGRAAAVLLGGSVVEFDVVVDPADVGGSLDFDDVLGSRLARVAADGGNIGAPGTFAESASGDPFSICSS